MYSSNDDVFVDCNVLFAIEPSCTEDGYVINKHFFGDKSFKFIRRYIIDIKYEKNDRFFVNENVENLFYRHVDKIKLGEYDSSMLYLGELQSPGKIRVFKNLKINVFVVKTGNNNYSHKFYININDNYCKCYNYTIKYLVYVRHDYMKKNNTVLTIELIVTCDSGFYDGTKACDFNAQKGICTVKDLKKKYPSMKPDIVCSAATIFGRVPMSQIAQIHEKPLDDDKLFGVCKMAFLKNIAADFKNVGPMKLDNLTCNMINSRNAKLTLYALLQNTKNKKDKYKLLPQSVKKTLQLYLNTKRNIEISMNGNYTELYD